MSNKQEKKYSVLLVDDDQFLLDMYAMKFSEHGCAVQAVSNPTKALEYLRKEVSPDIILLDVMMPGLTGFDFLQAVRNEDLAKNACVIMLTNQGQQEDVDKALSLGANGYIIKASAIPSEVLEKTMDIVQKFTPHA
jgi:DNA-binding response OmpR family regulator